MLWLDPDNAEPEALAFIRLMNDATARGLHVWEQPGIKMWLEGRWSEGRWSEGRWSEGRWSEGRWSEGGPTPQGRECLALLAPLLGLPITVCFTQSEDGPPQTLHFPA